MSRGKRVDKMYRCTGEIIRIYPYRIQKLAKYGIDWSEFPKLYLLTTEQFNRYVELHPQLLQAYEAGVAER